MGLVETPSKVNGVVGGWDAIGSDGVGRIVSCCGSSCQGKFGSVKRRHEDDIETEEAVEADSCPEAG